ncbi:MAG: ATP synthase subunit I [Simplicispira sp.]|nr:ATP synthase subunit I [Simplicispira sp.]
MTNSSPTKVEAEDEDLDFKPLTAQEAQEWRKRHPALSVWWLVIAQAMVGILVVLVTWLVSGKPQVAWSAGYGALAVVIPSILFARGMNRMRASAGNVLMGFFGWEMVKIALTVAMLAAAPKLIGSLSWLALLVGMVVTMKTYWIALWVRPGVRKTD